MLRKLCHKAILNATLLCHGVLIFYSDICLAAPQILSLLVPPHTVSPVWVQQFEKKNNVFIRMQFVNSRTEYEAKIRSSTHSVDLVLVDEQHAARLADSRVIKPWSQFKASALMSFPLTVLTSPILMSDDRNYFVPITADVLGIAWKRGSRSALEHVQNVHWDFLRNPSLSPRWRGRIAGPSGLKNASYRRLEAILALQALGLSCSTEDSRELLSAVKWIQEGWQQSHGVRTGVEFDLLSGRAAAAVIWLSEFTRLKSFVDALEFSVPDPGSYFTRLGFVQLADSHNEVLAAEFVKDLLEKSDALAVYANLVPLQAKEFSGSHIGNWKVYDDNLLTCKSVEGVLKLLNKSYPLS